MWGLNITKAMTVVQRVHRVRQPLVEVADKTTENLIRALIFYDGNAHVLEDVGPCGAASTVNEP